MAELDAEREVVLEKANQSRALRGMILSILNRSKGRPTMMRIIEQAVIAAGGSVPEAEEQVYYLESKGYIQRKGPADHKIPNIGEVLLITAAGIDLVEGTTADPGVTF